MDCVCICSCCLRDEPSSGCCCAEESELLLTVGVFRSEGAVVCVAVRVACAVVAGVAGAAGNELERSLCVLSKIPADAVADEGADSETAGVLATTGGGLDTAAGVVAVLAVVGAEAVAPPSPGVRNLRFGFATVTPSGRLLTVLSVPLLLLLLLLLTELLLLLLLLRNDRDDELLEGRLLKLPLPGVAADEGIAEDEDEEGEEDEEEDGNDVLVEETTDGGLDVGTESGVERRGVKEGT